MRIYITVFFSLLLLFPSWTASAQTPEETSPPAAAAPAPADQGDYERRLELAKKIQALRPAREQVDGAIDQYVTRLPGPQKEQYRTTLRGILNYQALEKISVDAYVETYTAKEMEAMVEYFSKPEAKSASDKFDNYANIVYPEIVRMLDKAMMQIKTGQ